MNGDAIEAAQDTAMDWALDERLGKGPPDVTAAVRARLAAAAPRLQARTSLFLVAAMLAFGTFVVLGVALWPREDVRQAGQQQTQDPAKPAHVGSREDIEALPADTRSVEGTGIEDDEVRALLRLQKLESLRLTAVLGSPFKPGEQVRPMNTLTDDGLMLLASLKSLRALHLHNQTDLEGPGLQVLTHFPALEELSLVYATVDDDALAALSRTLRLHTLCLATCTGVGPATIEHIAGIDTLRNLSLTGCTQLQAAWLVPLGRMKNLERLNLGMIGGGKRSFSFYGLARPVPGSGVTDAVLHALRGVKSLRSLNLDSAGVTSAGLRDLRTLPLEELDLSHTDISPDDLELLPPTLKILSLRGCRVDCSKLGETLAQTTPGLTHLTLGNCLGINDSGLAELGKHESLRVLDLSYCSNITAAAVPELCRFEWLEAVDLRGWKFLDEQLLAQIRAMPNLGRLTTDAGTEMR